MVFRVPKIKTFCFCMTLKTGSYVIAILEVLAYIFVAIVAATRSYRPATFNQVLYYHTVFMNVGVFSFILVYGLIKKSHVLMFPWILQQAIFLVFLLNYLFGSMVYHGVMNARPEEMVAECSGVVIVGYTLLVVYNYHRELKETPTEETD